MKTKSTLINDNEKLLQTIISRQTELEQLTSRLIHTDAKPEQIEKPKNDTPYKWFASHNTVLLNNAV